jgi:hypothetical protein
MALNNAQQRAIWATFIHVNELLEEVERMVRSDPGPFDRQRLDLTPLEARHLVAITSEARARMLEVLAGLGIPCPEPEGSARWNAKTSLLFAGIALSELEGRGLGAYGALSEQDQKHVTTVARDLRRVLERGRNVLGRADAARQPGASDKP